MGIQSCSEDGITLKGAPGVARKYIVATRAYAAKSVVHAPQGSTLSMNHSYLSHEEACLLDTV